MGVPAFYRWLSEKYPKIVVDLIEEKRFMVDGVVAPIDASQSNPNNIEFDNLYVDMNGIIHPCAHPEDAPAPSTEEEMYINIFHYVDRLFGAIRPRRLLFLAIDGVAPRAKMNQQRSRRFRTAQDEEHREEIEAEIREQMIASGRKDIPGKKQSWDSNVITPGTEFMDKLSKYLRYYIYERQNNDPAWRNVKVILSDASVPGEGEHKLMAFIRQQRSQPNYDPNMRHAIHGLDADLIMLGLATHEPYFTVVREEVLFGRAKKQKMEERERTAALELELAKGEGKGGESLPSVFNKPLQCLHISVLREYLRAEFAMPFDFERIIDDFVFICFFVGNDFLPHLPALDIRDGALDFLIGVYKYTLPRMGGYITDCGEVDLSRVDVILEEVGKVEDEVFRRRKHAEEGRKRGRERRKMEQQARQRAEQAIKDMAVNVSENKSGRQKRQSANISNDTENNEDVAGANALAAKRLKQQLLGKRGPAPAEGEKEEHSEESSRTATKDAESVEGGDLEVNGHKAKKHRTEESTADGSHQAEESARGQNHSESPSQGQATGEARGEGGGANVNGEAGEEESEEAGKNTDLSKKCENSSKRGSGHRVTVREAAEEELKRRIKEKEEQELDHLQNTVEDVVRLGEEGWKDRYYSDKYKSDDIAKGGGREKVFKAYAEGLCWVMQYYYKGVASWQWFYPFHYAPFASDLVDLKRFMPVKFTLGEPFRPFEQLMGVLPGRSAHALPKACRRLMCDQESPIIDFYPTEIPLDPNGKAMPWLFVVLLPFIDEERLLATIRTIEHTFTEEEQRRNRRYGDNFIFIHTKSKLFSVEGEVARAAKAGHSVVVETGTEGGAGGGRDLSSESSSGDGPTSSESPPLSPCLMLEPPTATTVEEAEKITVKAGADSEGFSGTLERNKDGVPIGGTVEAPALPRGLLENVKNNKCYLWIYHFPPAKPHECHFLPGTVEPPPSLSESDYQIKQPRFNRNGVNMAMLAPGAAARMVQFSLNQSIFHQRYQHQQQMQTGLRTWGSFEPAPKRGPPVHMGGTNNAPRYNQFSSGYNNTGHRGPRPSFAGNAGGLPYVVVQQQGMDAAFSGLPMQGNPMQFQQQARGQPYQVLDARYTTGAYQSGYSRNDRFVGGRAGSAPAGAYEGHSLPRRNDRGDYDGARYKGDRGRGGYADASRSGGAHMAVGGGRDGRGVLGSGGVGGKGARRPDRDPYQNRSYDAQRSPNDGGGAFSAASAAQPGGGYHTLQQQLLQEYQRHQGPAPSAVRGHQEAQAGPLRYQHPQQPQRHQQQHQQRYVHRKPGQHDHSGAPAAMDRAVGSISFARGPLQQGRGFGQSMGQSSAIGGHGHSQTRSNYASDGYNRAGGNLQQLQVGLQEGLRSMYQARDPARPPGGSYHGNGGQQNYGQHHQRR